MQSNANSRSNKCMQFQSTTSQFSGMLGTEKVKNKELEDVSVKNVLVGEKIVQNKWKTQKRASEIYGTIKYSAIKKIQEDFQSRWWSK